MADSRENTTVLGPDATFKGEMTFEGSAHIRGTFEGTVTSEGELHVDGGANVKATVKAQTISVDGKVEGDLNAGDRLELLARAEVKGDIICKTLVVVQGAAFKGHVTVGPDAATPTRADKPVLSAKPTRLPRVKPEGEWMADPVVAAPAVRVPEWAGQGASTAKPAWMTGAEEPKSE